METIEGLVREYNKRINSENSTIIHRYESENHNKGSDKCKEKPVLKKLLEKKEIQELRNYYFRLIDEPVDRQDRRGLEHLPSELLDEIRYGANLQEDFIDEPVLGVYNCE
jgi:hypothetical protein